MKEIKRVLFDLDGTITDPYNGITRCVQYALKKFGIESKQEELRCFIGPPLYDSFRDFFGLTAEESVKAVEYYRELYRDGGAIFDCTLYDGIPELLKALKNNGKSVIMATSKPEVFARRILEHFKIDDCFDGVCGSELDGRRVEKSDVIAYAFESYSLDKSECIMVGDRCFDVEGAHKNQIPCIGVLYGYGNAEEMKKSNADFIAGTVEDLAKLLL